MLMRGPNPDRMSGGVFGLSSTLELMRRIEKNKPEWLPVLYEMSEQSFGVMAYNGHQLRQIYKRQHEGPRKDIFKVGLSNLVDIIKNYRGSPKNLSFDLYSMKLVDYKDYRIAEETRPEKFKISRLKSRQF